MYSTHGLMIVCGVKTGDQDLLVQVLILTGTIMITGMRLETAFVYVLLISLKGGSSSNPCSETYHGAGPASEPETQNTENYFR